MKINQVYKRIAYWYRSLRFFSYYVIADGNDNSMTFSRRLYQHIELSSQCEDRAQVYVFYIPAWDRYGFVVNPELSKEETEIADIQYNEKYKTIGFQSLCPSVCRILYEYGLPCDRKTKLIVTVRRLAGGKYMYCIERP